MSHAPYNPLDKLNLGISVAEALLARPALAFDGLKSFDGAGIYVIYYHGPFEPYRPMAARNHPEATWPIYIGKAISSGGRKGELLEPGRGPHLFKRLREHAESIQAADNLDLADFRCRLLIVDDIWIPLGETLLISTFRPPWNIAVEGFGNHNPGAGRHNGQRPRWDILHPGRKWAMRLRDRDASAESIANRLATFLARNPPRADAYKSLRRGNEPDLFDAEP